MEVLWTGFLETDGFLLSLKLCRQQFLFARPAVVHSFPPKGDHFSLCMSRADRSKHRRAPTLCFDPDRLGLAQSRQAEAWTIYPADNKTKVRCLGSYGLLLANLSERWIYRECTWIDGRVDRLDG